MKGRKELLLFPPSDLERLEYTARPKGTLRYAWPSDFTREPISAQAAQERVLFAASVNLTHPSPAQRAALARCAPLRCTLHPGETLYLPAFWHHEVYSHPAGDDADDDDGGGEEEEEGEEARLNVAVNFWFRNETWYDFFP